MPASPSSTRLFLTGGLFLAVGFFVYWPSITGGFIWDDELNIVGNDLVKASNGLYRMWFTTEPYDYWPLTNTSYWIEWRLWGANPAGYHVTNILLHVANALLAWTILRRLMTRGALLASLLFLVHPVNVESVAWITQRKNALSMIFFLASILFYLRQFPSEPAQIEARAPGKSKSRKVSPATTASPSAQATGAKPWFSLSLAAFTLAMLSKGSVVVLPAVLLLIAWWQHGRVALRDLQRTAPFFAIGIALTLVNVWFQTHGQDPIRQVTLVERALGAGAIVWFYLSKALLPIDLSFIYPQWRIVVSDFRWWLPLLGCVVVTLGLIWQRHRPLVRALLFAWLFFGIALVPVMGFADVYFMKFSLVADHYQYVALLGVCAAIGAAVETLARRLN